jgi:spore coat protein CotH
VISLKDIKFVSNDDRDYIRRLERAYEMQQKEIKRLESMLKEINHTK